MKSYDSRTYSINDFVEWNGAKQLKLNPLFQRRPVWTDSAKSFLIDTILRGKPIPKVFIRQKINVTTKMSVREVVDGQQRLRTILAYVGDGFAVSKRHNPEFGGLLFSQLPEEVQAQVLAYEVSVDLLINLPDAEVLDIFSRLNSYAVVLNEQEKINATHFGPFKVLADRIGHKYVDYWTKNQIVPPKQVMRMQEVNLVADLLIAMIEGIRSKKQVKKYYAVYESSFPPPGAPQLLPRVDLVDGADHGAAVGGNEVPGDNGREEAPPAPDQSKEYAAALEERFDAVITAIADLFPNGLVDTEFRRPPLFYSLFTAVAHRLHGIRNLPDDWRQVPLNFEQARTGLDRVAELVGAEHTDGLNRDEQVFLTDFRRATTDEVVRLRRSKFLLDLMAHQQ